MAQKTKHPHDLLLKATLSYPQAIQDFFQAHLPRPIQARINLASIQPGLMPVMSYHRSSNYIMTAYLPVK